MSRSENEICAVCRIVRTYLLIAVPLLAMVGFSSMSGDHEEASPWFARVELINFLAALAIISLVVVVALRAYQEFWIPKKKQEKLDTLVSQLRDDREEC
jgi:Kef-type K+ transport system membrane component KefB